MARKRFPRLDWDDRLGEQHERHKLKEDGERPGVWTIDPDPPDHRRNPVVPGPDGVDLFPRRLPPFGAVANVIPGVNVWNTFIASDRTSYPAIRCRAGRVPIEINGSVVRVAYGAYD